MLIDEVFILYMADRAAEDTYWNGVALQSKTKFIELSPALLKGYIRLSIEQGMPIIFSGFPELPNDLIVSINSIEIDNGVLFVTIDFRDPKKTKHKDRQVSATKRKLDRMSPFNTVQFKVRFKNV